MDTFRTIYTVFGGLGIFFLGMKMMSESLQSVAGNVIRKIINSLTSNPVLAVIVGTLVTIIVQSSSVSTVMVIGLVNAGLMKLVQAIGVILGANIGTTITGWIISIKVGKYGLLLIALGAFPAIFSNNEKIKYFARALFGVGLIFLGLKTMGEALKPLKNSPDFIDAISYFAGTGILNYLASMLMGCVLTMVIQSSSAMLGVTMALATTGVISFHTAAALVLGENIGTTITALLASVGGNVNAKRAARAHASFNLLGVLIMMCILPQYIDFVEWLVPGDANFLDANGDRPNIASHIATTHTVFNVTAAILFLPFIGKLTQFVIWITPDKKAASATHLVSLGNPRDNLPSTSILQAEEQIKKFNEIVERMFELTRSYLHSNTKDPAQLAKIKDYEQITDNIQKEVAIFCTTVMQMKLNKTESAEIQFLIKASDELESVADYLERMAVYKSNFEASFNLEGESHQEFWEFFGQVHEYYRTCAKGLEDLEGFDASLCDRKSNELQLLANDLRNRHLSRVADGKYSALSTLTYSDMIVALRKIRSHSHNLSDAIRICKTIIAE